MERREFLIRAGLALVAAPAVLSITACGGDGGTTPAPVAAADFAVTSTSVGGHTHDITVKKTDLEAGVQVTYLTTNSNNHTHNVTLAVADITNINNNLTVTVTSDTGNGAVPHTHNFSIKKP